MSWSPWRKESFPPYFDLDDGRSIQSETRFTDLLDVFVPKNERVDVADVQLAWTDSLLLEGPVNDAMQHLKIAETMMRRLHDPDLDKDYLVAAARVAAKQGRTHAAEAMLAKCLKQAEKRRDVPTQMNLYLELAQVLTTQRNRRSDTLLHQYATEARRREFLRVAGGIEALRVAHKS